LVGYVPIDSNDPGFNFIKLNVSIDEIYKFYKQLGRKRTDLKEIGSQRVVSEILTGKRTLNLEQIKKISKRFLVSPLVFI